MYILQNRKIFKLKIVSKNGLNELFSWYEKYKKYILKNIDNITIELSAGLDSRILLSMFYKEIKHVHIINYFKDEQYDIDFVINFLNENNISYDHDIKKKILGGHDSNYCRKGKDFKSLSYIKKCLKTKKIKPFLDKKILKIDPLYPDLLHTILLLKYSPELLEYDFLTYKTFYKKEDLPIQMARSILKCYM